MKQNSKKFNNVMYKFVGVLDKCVFYTPSWVFDFLGLRFRTLKCYCDKKKSLLIFLRI